MRLLALGVLVALAACGEQPAVGDQTDRGAISGAPGPRDAVERFVASERVSMRFELTAAEAVTKGTVEYVSPSTLRELNGSGEVLALQIGELLYLPEAGRLVASSRVPMIDSQLFRERFGFVTDVGSLDYRVGTDPTTYSGSSEQIDAWGFSGIRVKMTIGDDFLPESMEIRPLTGTDLVSIEFDYDFPTPAAPDTSSVVPQDEVCNGQSGQVCIE